jgi:hypothetical protein
MVCRHRPVDLLFRAAFVAAALFVAGAAQATLYKWVDQNGDVTYSNVPPPPGAQVRELETIDENRAPTATELRTRQILEEVARERRGTAFRPGTAAKGSTSASATGVPYGDDPSAIKYEWVPQGSPALSGPSLQDYATARYPPATPITVRDPCLLSADPRCYELNAANYDPYLGYAPARMQVPPTGFGANRSVASGAFAAAGAPSEPRNEAGGASGATGATGGAVSGTVVARDVSDSTAAAARPAAAQATTRARPSLRGLPPGTPILPISR